MSAIVVVILVVIDRPIRNTSPENSVPLIFSKLRNLIHANMIGAQSCNNMQAACNELPRV